MPTTLMMDSDLIIKILNKEKDINYGAIYGNVVAQLLNSHGFENLYYYTNKKYDEIDFAVELNGEIFILFRKSNVIVNLIS